LGEKLRDVYSRAALRLPKSSLISELERILMPASRPPWYQEPLVQYNEHDMPQNRNKG
jgi:hypothetical protein